jgi:L-ascorbate metabolism protein UlaG (beta-lactamase superfamily)
MKRRDFVRYAGSGFLAIAGLGAISSRQPTQAQPAEGVTVRWLGHTCFLFTGGGRRILVNPFRPIGCTAGYSAPDVEVDLVMISSRLLDEGVTETLPGDPRLLDEPGIYEFQGMQVQGIRMDHDDLGGRRFGDNVAWRWNQGGVNLLHLGGAAAPITVEQQILMGRPDVLLLPVGNGPKAFTPQEAKAEVDRLSPKIVIPTHYRTAAADEATCDILPVDDFLSLMEGTPVQQVGADAITIRPVDLPEAGPLIRVLSYPFGAA